MTTRSPSSIISSPLDLSNSKNSQEITSSTTTTEKNTLPIWKKKMIQQYYEEQDQVNNMIRSRPRAETMPTSFPYSPSNLIIDQQHQWHDSAVVTSPTTPTTDQLLKGDDNNTIASTFASLGLDDSEHQQQQFHHTANHHHQQIRNIHSYSSLSTLNEEDWQEQQQQFYGLRPSIANLRLNTNRPRAMSSVDPSHQKQQQQQLDLNNKSIWYDNSRPFLRTSNSSADLLEMIARQRKNNSSTTANSSPSMIHIEPQHHHTTWATGETYTTGTGSISSCSFDQDLETSFSFQQALHQQQQNMPTKSLWLGQLEITNQTSNELSLIFSKFGVIESIRILPDRECAFINYSTVEEALKARDIFVNKMNCRLPNMTTVKVGFGKSNSSGSSNNGATQQQQTTEASPTSATANNMSLLLNDMPTRALWVGNIPQHTTQAALASIFSSFGMIESIRVLSHKSCGFVNYFTQEDAIRAKKGLQNQEIMGADTGAIKIGFAKVPSLPTAVNGNKSAAIGGLVMMDNSNSMSDYDYQPVVHDAANNNEMFLYHQMMEMMGNGGHVSNNSTNNNIASSTSVAAATTNNMLNAIITERKLIMQEFGLDDSDGPIFDDLHLPQTYYHIPAAPELGQSRKVDISRLRDIRKRLDIGNITTKELEIIAVECVDELVELCSDYIGNTVIQRLFERCSEQTKSMMLEAVAPFLASIGVHKNGTWAAQKIIDTAKLPAQISLVCGYIRPYVPALLLDQFGNYVVQCCLTLGPTRNQFIFDAIVDSCWEVAQGRFGARAVRATLESPHVTKGQQKYVAASLVQHALALATNANGALLLIWLLDTSGIPGRYRVLAPRLLPHLAQLCTHKLASLTVLKLINQRQEPDARALLIDTLFFNEHTFVIDEILHDQVHGVSLVQKILSSSYIELRERQHIAERAKQLLCKLKLQHVQGYKRLMEEINMVMVDSAPGASLGVTLPGQFSISPGLAAALQAKYMEGSNSSSGSGNTNGEEEGGGGSPQQAAMMMANIYAAAAAAAAAAATYNTSNTTPNSRNGSPPNGHDSLNEYQQ